MRDITLEELLEAGCHFGHQVNRRNPKADEFIFEARDNINIINLDKTREGLLAAAEYVKSLAQKGGKIVIVGTKRQAKGIVEEEVARAKAAGAPNLYFVTARWIGGILTNADEVAKNYKKLKEIGEFLNSKKTSDYTKRELIHMDKDRKKLENLYSGIADIDGLPDALFIIDTHMEKTAISEAKVMGVATVGIVDTNADPAAVDYAIPANDDAVGSLKVIVSYIVDAWIEGSKSMGSGEMKVEKKKETVEKKEEAPKAEIKKPAKVAVVKKEAKAPVEEKPKAKKVAKKESK